MKGSCRFIIFILCILIFFVQSSAAQKLIRIDGDLKSNSQQLKAKRKGISSVGKYEFGSYIVISGKGGVGKTTQKSPLFSDNSSIQYTTSKSFVFVNEQGDTAFASIHVAENVEIDGAAGSFELLLPGRMQR